jgi:hypothetical protein
VRRHRDRERPAGHGIDTTANHPGDDPSGGEPGSALDEDERARTPRERAFVIVWMASLLIVLLTIAGFAVDLSHWWLEAEKLQRAVDAGAHAGAVFLPSNVPSAKTTARKEAAKNGFNDGALAGPVNATITPQQQANPYQLKVTGTTTVDNFFLSLIGLDTLSITRDAVGEFEVPIAMGSPENKMGDDPEQGHLSSQFWINVAGPDSTKVSGDRYQAKVCPTSVAKCTGTVNAGINSDDYAFDGYFYTVDVKSVVAGQDLVVQVYDGAMTYVGDFCERAVFPSAAELTTLQGLAGNPYPDATARYAGGLTDWCTGDQRINSGQDTHTTFLMRAPDDTPWSDTDNPVVSSGTCTPQTLPAYNPSAGNIYTWLHPTVGGDSEWVMNDSDGVWTFAETFRRWATVCTIPSGSVQTGEYMLQVRSNASSAAPEVYNASNAEKGHNRMSLRVGFGATGAAALDGSHVTIASRSKMPIYANANGADTSFHLARIVPADAGRVLRVNLFDMGDAASAGTLRILAPADANVSFTGCSFSRDNGGSLSVSSNCQLNNVSSGTGFNGRIVQVDVPIPDNYDCDDSTPTGCWTKVLADFPGGVNDTTTWSASILGSPVRLVE